MTISNSAAQTECTAVLIVGGGPVGLLDSYEFERRGDADPEDADAIMRRVRGA